MDRKSEIELKKKYLLLSRDILNSVIEKFGDRVNVIYDKRNRSKIMVDPKIIVKMAIFLRDNHGFDHVESASEQDFPK